MKPDIFQSAGLNKLSRAEMRVLDSWLTAALPVMVALTTGAGTATTTVGSEIDGDFHGWDGETVYKLRNGQVWQQSSYHYHYHFAYAPHVLIYPTNSGYKIHVDGDDDDDVSVRRLN